MPDPVPATELPRPIEHRDNRETVVNAFNTAFSRLDTKPENRLTEKEKWAKQSIKAAKEKTIDQNKSTFTNEFPNRITGGAISQEEGIPIEDLLDFLRKEITALPPDADERKELIKAGHILFRNSQGFTTVPNRMDTERLFSRVSQEALFVSQDSRDKGDDVTNWLDAESTLMHRLELVIPVDGTSTPSAETPVPTPAPTTAEAAVIPPPAPTLEEIAALPPAPADGSGDIPSGAPTTTENVRRDFVIINRTVDIQKRASELAEEQLRNEMRRGSALNPLNWFRKVSLRVGEDYFRRKFIERASRAMIDNSNSYLTMDVVKNAAVQANHRISEERAAGRAKVEQIKTGEVLAGQNIQEVQGPLKEMIIADIIRPIADGQIMDEEQLQDRLRIFVRDHQNDPQVQAVFGRDATQYGRVAEYFASDLLETAQAVKQDLDAHRYAVDQLKDIVNIRLANTSWAAETQATFNRVDRQIAWIQSKLPTAWGINPPTIALAYTAGVSALGFVSGRVFGRAVTQAANIVAPGAGTLAGAGFAALRRNYDLKVDMASHRAERAYGREILPHSPRRETLERFNYNTASVSDLIDGQGQELTTGTDRRSLQDLLAQDLSNGQTTNREAVIRRIAEIKSRLDFSAGQNVDLVTFGRLRGGEAGGREQVEQGRLQLIKAVVEARQALRSAGMTDAEITPFETTFTGDWNQRFTQNRDQQDRAFRNYRVRNALGAGAFASATGLGVGLLGQEAFAQIGRHVPGVSELPVVGRLFSKGETALEKGLDFVNIHIGPESSFNQDLAKDLFTHPGSTAINKDITASVAPDHTVTFLDHAGNKIPTPPVHLTPDGNFIASGDPANFPADVKNAIGGWEQHANASLNIHEKIKALAQSGQHETFTHGNAVIDVNSGPQGQMSMEVGGVQIHGFVKPDGTIDFDKSFNGNARLTGAQLQALNQTLDHDGWGITFEHQPGQGSVIDAFLKQPADVLRQQGIVETDTVNKTWNFHVLRPDIVAATGMHTHNELTLHVGMLGRTGNLGEGFVWGQAGTPGQLNFGGEIHGGLIQSHLFGVPPKVDAALNELMQRSGGLKLSQMEMVVDLTDGRQIMLAMDPSGNAKLPDGLFDPATGALHGIKSIAAAVIQGPDGKILPSSDILNNGVPGGSVVHSLASEKFPEVSLPSIPAKDIFHLDPPVAFDIISPAADEAPLFVPVPFALRHPLEPLLFIYGYGSEYTRGEMGLLPWSEYANRRSSTLIDNPNADLNERHEINAYFDRQPQPYRQELEEMDLALNRPMSERRRVVFAIPAYEEGGNIRKTLEHFLQQKDKNGNPLDPDLFEIIILDNHPADVPKDNTESETQAFLAAHPQMNVLYAEKVWKPGEAGVGNARKYANDLALLRSNKRSNQAGDLILISNDADLDGISNKYVADIINEFDTKREVDALAGKWTLPESTLKKPNVRAAERLWYILDRVITRDAAGNPNQRQLRTPGLIGRNAAFRASMYAAIGGYNPNAKLAEDLEIGWMINEARGWNPQRVSFLNSAELVSNPRRFLAATVQGIPLIQMYGGFHENRDVRKLDNQQLLNLIPDNFDIARFEKEADALWQSSKSGQYQWLGNRFDTLFGRTMGLVGAEYRIENDHVKITNVNRLLTGMQRPINSTP